MKLAIMGTGGLGGYIGGRLAQAGLNVTFIARGKHLQAIRECGLQVYSVLGDFHIEPAQATDDPTTVGPVDLIFFCVKAYDALNAATMLAPMIDPQTIIIPIENGIDHLETISSVVGASHVMGGCAWIAAHVTGPGIIQHIALDTLLFGERSGDISARCTAIQQALMIDGCKIRAVPNIMELMWEKFVRIASNGVATVVRGGAGVVRSSSETLELIRQSMAEAVAIGQARGISLKESILDDFIHQWKTWPPELKSSMLVDLERGHRLELESVNGAICRYGRELGISTPVNDFVYACLKPYVNGPPQLGPIHTSLT